jgi:hypothetical protein
VRRASVLAAAIGAAAIALSAAAGASPAESSVPCAGLTPPRRVTTGTVELPPSYSAARAGGVVVDEAVVGIDGKLSGLRLVRARFAALAPFGQKSVESSRFEAASIEGNPVAARVRIATTLGMVSKARIEPEYDIVWAHVAGGQSREAQWQLAKSVGNLTVTARLGTVTRQDADIVAVAPDKKERVLVRIPASEKPVDVHQTVATEKFFWPAGDYRLELRSGGKTLAWTTLTIADDHTRAIVNACEPI